MLLTEKNVGIPNDACNSRKSPSPPLPSPHPLHPRRFRHPHQTPPVHNIEAGSGCDTPVTDSIATTSATSQGWLSLLRSSGMPRHPTKRLAAGHGRARQGMRESLCPKRSTSVTFHVHNCRSRRNTNPRAKLVDAIGAPRARATTTTCVTATYEATTSEAPEVQQRQSGPVNRATHVSTPYATTL